MLDVTKSTRTTEMFRAKSRYCDALTVIFFELEETFMLSDILAHLSTPNIE